MDISKDLGTIQGFIGYIQGFFYPRIIPGFEKILGLSMDFLNIHG
jgi:hypothetical protein